VDAVDGLAAAVAKGAAAVLVLIATCC